MMMTDSELESRVVATLRAKSEQLPLTVRAFDPDAVPLAPLAARGRRRLPVLVAAVAALVVVVAIGVALVLVDRDSSTEPAGEPARPVSQLQIVALPTLSYQTREFTTEPGLNEIEFWSQGGTHGLVFDDPALRDISFAPATGGATRRTVDLAPGRDYVVHDIIPGHEQAGERAVIHVTNGPAGPTKGSISQLFEDVGDGSQASEPDYVQVDTYGGRPVYVKRIDYLPPGGTGLVPAYAEDLSTLVGHRDPQRGFIPLGTDPASAPQVATTSPPSTAP
jgi:hypothetical protein